MTLISRVLGFVRDVVFARMIGAGLGADAFFVAFKIPNFLRRLFAEGAFSQAFVPVLSEEKEQGDHAAVRELVDYVAGTLGIILFAVSLVGVIAAPLVITVFAPGFLDENAKFDLATQMLRITFPYLLFISLTAFCGALLNSYGRFAVPAFTPVFLNLSLIGSAIWLAPLMDQPVLALAWGVFIAGVVQLAFQIPFLLRLKLVPRPKVSFAHKGVRKIIDLMLPAIFGVSVTQINLLIDTLLASLLVTGSVSWLYYSDRLVEFPLGILGIALATVILPGLSQKHSQGSAEAFSRTLDWALRWVFIVGTPAMLGLFLLAGPMLATLFEYGAFKSSDTSMAARSLMAYSLGLLGFILVKVLAPGYFARQDIRTPVRIGIIAMLCNMVLNLIFIVPLAHAGLALATSASAFINAGLLYRGLRREKIYRPESGWPKLMLQCLLAIGAMVAYLLWATAPLEFWSQASAWQRGAELGKLIALAALIYVSVLLATGLKLKNLISPAE